MKIAVREERRSKSLGQHEPEHIGALREPLANGQADVSIDAFPERNSHARRFAWRYFRWLTDLALEDITSGFRAYNHAAMTLLASQEASLLDYQDIGVLLILRSKGFTDHRSPGLDALAHKIFRSWQVVGKYLLHISLLCITRVGYHI